MKQLFSYNVLICLTTFEMGGAERQALNLANLLKKEGANVIVASFSADGPVKKLCQENNIQPIQISDKISFRNLLAIVARINKLKIDTIFSYCTHANIIMALSFPFTHAAKLFWGQRDAGSGYHIIKNFPGILDLPTAAISNSIAGKIFLRNLSKKLKIYHIQNTIQPNPPFFSREQWRQKLGISPHNIVFLMVANLTRLKAHDLLLHAWSLAQKSDSFSKNAILILAGREDDQAIYLHKLTSQLGIDHSVLFLGQISDISGLILSADICVFSSRNEGLPNGVLECMYYGLPVIALDNIGTREACASVSKNLLVQPHTAEALKEGLLRFYSNPHLGYIGKENCFYVKHKFSPNTFISSYIELMKKNFQKNTLLSIFNALKCLSLFYIINIKQKINKRLI